MLTPLAKKAALRTHQAFRPKTRQAYDAMFRVFVAFCIISAVVLPDINVGVIMSFLECLVENNCSCAMLENYMSAIKTNCILYDLPYYVYFLHFSDFPILPLIRFPPSILPGIILVMMYSSLRNLLKSSSNGRKPFNPEIQCSVLHSQNCRIPPFVLSQH